MLTENGNIPLHDYRGGFAFGCSHLRTIRFLRVIVLPRAVFSGFKCWMLLLHARSLRTDFCAELLNEISIRLEIVASTIGSLFLALDRKRSEHPFGDLPGRELFLGPRLQIGHYCFCQIQRHVTSPFFPA